jgi:hypothetical protein
MRTLINAAQAFGRDAIKAGTKAACGGAKEILGVDRERNDPLTLHPSPPLD